MSRKMLINGEVDNTPQEEVQYEFDLFVIGAGSGGVRAARFAAQLGAKVGICELPFHPISSEVIGGVGGTCVIRGCVPKKILVYGANYGPELEPEKVRASSWMKVLLNLKNSQLIILKAATEQDLSLQKSEHF